MRWLENIVARGIARGIREEEHRKQQERWRAEDRRREVDHLVTIGMMESDVRRGYIDVLDPLKDYARRGDPAAIAALARLREWGEARGKPWVTELAGATTGEETDGRTTTRGD
jgi:hypothetical protein